MSEQEFLYQKESEAAKEMAEFSKSFLDNEILRRRASTGALSSSTPAKAEIISSSTPIESKKTYSKIEAPDISYPLKFYVWKKGKLSQVTIMCEYPPSQVSSDGYE